MATDIVPQNEVWGTLLMKPDPGEEGNALWADKIAANEGWLFHNYFALIHREDPWSGVFRQDVSGLRHFQCRLTGSPNNGTLIMFARAKIGSSGTINLSIRGDVGTSSEVVLTTAATYSTVNTTLVSVGS